MLCLFVKHNSVLIGGATCE